MHPSRRQGSDPVRIIATIGQQHRSRLQSRQEFASKSVVVRLTGRQREPHRQAIGIDQRMNLAGQSTSRPPHRLSSVPCDARPMLMHANNGRVDHLHGGIMSAGECAHDLGPHARPSPANEAIVAGRVRTEVVRQIAPWRPRSQDPEDAIEDTTVIHSWHAARLIRQHRLDGSPLIVGEFVAHDSAPSVRGLNHGSAGRAQHARPRALWSRCTRKRTRYTHFEFCRS